MKNRQETPFRQSRTRRLLPDHRIIILIFLAAFLIRFTKNLDAQLKVLTFGDSDVIVQNDELLAKRIEKDTWNKSPGNSSSFSNITENDTAFDNRVDPPYLVEIRGNESFLWQGAQSRLCTHIKKEQKKLKKLKSDKKMHLSLVTSCETIHDLNQHGNFMIGYYAMKVAAMAFQSDFSFRCIERERKDYMLWWLQSKNTIPATESTPRITWTATPHNEGSDYLVNKNLYTPSQPTTDVACKGMGKVALHYASENVRKEMRAMADELLPSMESKGITIDEVAIHLRCGDIISKKMSSKDKNYGLVQFQAYRKSIPPSVESIGIVTAPFSDENRRKQDVGSGEICRTLVFELVDYLESQFPKAEVRVRNSPNESIPEVVSRLILAKHNFCVRSTFCLLPSIASYGMSYIQKGGIAYFVEDVSKVYDDVVSMDEPFLLSREIRERGFNSTLRWLTES
mmetsp:Transcript_14334/g.36003  ORF Transcript_14334/g.36003 Transcript_14334/m.36003 type:complete len:454 (-) Transcript_14334:82-1443(-)|eukprot:CAMPEP_0116080584 /NCGR_PEP_ID=MMETSP0327-20121206/1754_1 /TAXON_ID=44447 /ORGANISM="Pseudo-nitzschia delicatissima, Strain B596" /LENGTH=453 /DNA_ID=CAMNT_0003571287 /DNA_START=114 /DNA_END=1475 /DNA_ORIENTATION=-